MPRAFTLTHVHTRTRAPGLSYLRLYVCTVYSEQTLQHAHVHISIIFTQSWLIQITPARARTHASSHPTQRKQSKQINSRRVAVIPVWICWGQALLGTMDVGRWSESTHTLVASFDARESLRLKQSGTLNDATTHDDQSDTTRHQRTRAVGDETCHAQESQSKQHTHTRTQSGTRERVLQITWMCNIGYV